MMLRHGLIALTATVAFVPVASAQTYDVLIRGGTVFDGSDAPERKADVAITGDRVVAVGTIPATARARTTIDATGKIVAPGFIDPHSHAGTTIGTSRLAAALPILHQGITTIMINPDGGGPANLSGQIADIRAVVPGVNVIPLIGHNAVRQQVLGGAARKPTPQEQARMEGLVTAAMRAGAWGLSSGPFYVPGKYSETPEIVGLAKAAARFPHAFYTSHIRDEGDYNIGMLASVDEVISVARAAEIPGIVTHIKLLGPLVWGQARAAIARIERARAEGVQIWADQYPYTASGSSLQSALVPAWAQEGGGDALAKRLADPAMRARIRSEMEPNLARRAGAGAIMFRRYAPDPSVEGQRLDAVARKLGREPLDVVIDMLRKGGAAIVSFNMSDADVDAFMRQPWTMTTTDGALPAFGEGAEHPRAYGAFPRKLRHYVLDRNVISMRQAIHAATGLPATVFAIPDRGFLRKGAFADVIVFDPAKVRDTATFTRPHAYAVGMEHIFINGEPALTNGKPTTERHGRLLLRDGSTK